MLARRGLLRNADPHRGARTYPIAHGCAHGSPLECAHRRPARLAMTVNLTRIYTKLGDGGETHLGDMSRVSKLHPRVEAYGTVDELNATIGVALLQPGLPRAFAAWLAACRTICSTSAPTCRCPRPRRARGRGPRATCASAPTTPRGSSRPATRSTRRLQPLRSFVIPGGTPAAAHLHVCRTVCRRAERRAIAVGEDVNPEVVRYLNRLSDLLFILSRAANAARRQARPAAEPLWEPGAHGDRSAEPGVARRRACARRGAAQRSVARRSPRRSAATASAAPERRPRQVAAQHVARHVPVRGSAATQPTASANSVANARRRPRASARRRHEHGAQRQHRRGGRVPAGPRCGADRVVRRCDVGMGRAAA